jgi:hypothetical protein
MRDISIQLSGINGEPLGKLRTSAWQLIEKAEQEARNRNLSKNSALKAVLGELLEESEFNISNNNLLNAVESLDLFRRGKDISNLQIMVQSIPQKSNGNGANTPATQRNMPNNPQEGVKKFV